MRHPIYLTNYMSTVFSRALYFRSALRAGQRAGLRSARCGHRSTPVSVARQSAQHAGQRAGQRSAPVSAARRS